MHRHHRAYESEEEEMAVSKINCFKTIVQFEFDVDKLNCVELESPEIVLSEVHWKIKLAKRTADPESVNKFVLDVMLLAVRTIADENTAAWSCEARAVFKLMSSDAENEIVKTISKRGYNNECSMHQIKDFICWNEMTDPENRYVIGNKATLQAEISTNPLKREKSTELEVTSTDFRVVIENVNKLGINFSPKVTVRGIRWELLTAKENEHLCVFLSAINDDMDSNWVWAVHCSFKLLTFNPAVDSVTEQISSRRFQWGSCSRGYPQFMKWSEFVDPKNFYVRKDTAIIEVRLTVESPKPLWECEENPPNLGSPLKCSICFEKFQGREVSSTKCGHMFCTECITKSITDRKECPLCNAAASDVDLRPIFLNW